MDKIDNNKMVEEAVDRVVKKAKDAFWQEIEYDRDRGIRTEVMHIPQGEIYRVLCIDDAGNISACSMVFVGGK